MIKETLVEK